MSVVTDLVARVSAQKSEKALRPPVLVFDLDGTLFDNGPRTWRILVDFAERHGHDDLRRALDNSPRERLPYVLGETLARLSVTDAAVVESAAQYWKSRFFTDHEQQHDIPIEGALALAKGCYDAGATLVYLSGRDVPNMLIGVCQSLRAHGFPVGLARTSVVLKPHFNDDDLHFKKSAFDFIDTMGTVVGTFDNEPANSNAFQERWPDALHVFVKTQHAPNPPPLHPSIVAVDDLT
ncbi:MAG: haloacid dehalogenase-like hydrolase [Deltaproteobacteria bacterium]|nr:haloacid dehalogenase-like hydrolase [Deltaproteobacteria bacterium]